MSCLDENTLLEFLGGRLSLLQANQAELHIAQCAPCRRLLAALAKSADEVSWGQEHLSSGETATTYPSEGNTSIPQDTNRRGEGTSRRDRSWRFPVGTLIEHFSILRPIGRGGMGEVYLARDTKLGRKVALKMILPEALGSRDTRERFLFEARTTARFNHPHIVTIYAVGEHLGAPYVALEYLEGQTLQDRLVQERPSRQEALRMALAMAEALHEAHQHQILHRDLKPANVMITRDGQLRVLDFGLAKVISAETKSPLFSAHSATIPPAESLQESDPGSFASHGMGLRGSPFYMAPEQWRVERCTTATDIWALGVILYQMVSGQHPFPAPSLLKLRERIIEAPAPALPRLEVATPELSRLIAACLQQDPQQRPSAAEVLQKLRTLLSDGPLEDLAAQIPFRGLKPFTQRHAAFFFGREPEVAAFLERLREESLLLVVGPSGVGKSSFVQAGVIPRLREQGGWQVLQMRPRTDPFRGLVEQLLPGGSASGETASSEEGRELLKGGALETRTHMLEQQQQLGEEREQLYLKLISGPQWVAFNLHHLAHTQAGRVLLFVDQLEELFTHVDDPVLRRGFLQALCAAADDPLGPVRVAFTIRDDFLYRLMENLEQWEAPAHLTFLRTPSDQALAEVLVKPLDALGYHYDDPTLVQEMIDAVHDDVAKLPLLQFIARRLWEGREVQQRVLQRATYEAMGGVTGALVQHGESILGGLSQQEIGLAREVLLRLVTGEGTRRILPRKEVLEGLPIGAAEVLDRLCRTRLITVTKTRGSADNEPRFELVHETLIQAWPTLSRWVEESREGRRLLAEVSQAAELWERRGCREDEVWQGGALLEIQRYLQHHPTSIPERIRAFVESGQRLDRRHHRRRRVLRASLVVLLTVVAVAALIAAWTLDLQKREAQKQQRNATTQKQTARQHLSQAQREGARLALLRDYPLEARAKLRTSLEIEDALASRGLWRRLQQRTLQWKKDLGSIVFDVAFSPDGRTIAAATQESGVFLLNRSDRSSRTLWQHQPQVFSLAYAPDGRHLVSGTTTGKVRLWNLERRTTTELSGHSATVWAVAFAPDGRMLATGSSDHTIRLWNLHDGTLLRVITGPGSSVLALAFSPDSKRLASGGSDHTVRLWDPVTGVEQRVLRGHQGAVYAVSFDPGGGRLASGSSDRSVRIWNLDSSPEEEPLWGHTNTVARVRFSPDGRLLASASHDRTIRIWEVKTRKIQNVLQGHDALVFGLAFSPDGRELVSGGYDQSVRLWRLDRSPPTKTVPISGVRGVAFSPDGRQLALGCLDKTIQIWDTATAELEVSLQGHDNTVSGVSFAPGGRLLASASYDQNVRIWDLRSQREVHLLQGHQDKVRGVAFGPDGTLLASYGDDQQIRLWNAGTGVLHRILRGHQGAVIDARFSPDGHLLASASADQTVRLWSPTATTPRKTLRGHLGQVWGVGFSSDGTLLASGGLDGMVQLWDTRTGAGRTLLRVKEQIFWLDVSPRGRIIGAPLADGAALMVNLDSGERQRFKLHRQAVDYLRFSPDGKLVVTTSDDQTVQLWQADTGRPVWRAPALLPSPPELFTHRGWQALGPSRAALGQERWRQAVAHHAVWAGRALGGKILCLRGNNDSLEVWDIAQDRLLFSREVPGLQHVEAFSTGCVIHAGDRVQHYLPSGEVRLLVKNALLIAQTRDQLLVVTREGIRSLEGQKWSTPMAIDLEVTALVRVGERYLVGTADGKIRLISRDGSSQPLGGTHSLAVTRLLPVSNNLVAVGYLNGVLELRNLSDGEVLEQSRLRGAIRHLLFEGKTLHAASSLGDSLSWDLSVFQMRYCDLLRLVWHEVPVVAEGAHLVLRPPPLAHPCAGAAPVK